MSALVAVVYIILWLTFAVLVGWFVVWLTEPKHVHALIPCSECGRFYELAGTRAALKANRWGWVCPDCTVPVDFDPNDSQIGGHAPHWAASRARDIAHRNTTEDET